MFVASEFVFVHTPKTGGSTVTNVMQRKATNAWWLRMHGTLEQLPKEFGQGKFIFTFVRHPETWRKSWYGHMRSNPNKLWPYHMDMFLAKRDGVKTYEQAIKWCIANPDMCYATLFQQYRTSRDFMAKVFTMENMAQDLQTIWTRLGWGELPEFVPRNPGRYDGLDFTCSAELMERYLKIEAPIIKAYY